MKNLICGFMGAGKTTKLRELEAQGSIGYSYYDLDFEIEKVYGKVLHELIDEKGWEWFRKIEKDMLLNLITIENCWISLGGGTLTPMTVEEIKLKENLQIYWLNTDFEVCYQRIKGDHSRPLAKKSYDELKQLYLERCEIYAKFPEL